MAIILEPKSNNTNTSTSDSNLLPLGEYPEQPTWEEACKKLEEAINKLNSSLDTATKTVKKLTEENETLKEALKINTEVEENNGHK